MNKIRDMLKSFSKSLTWKPVKSPSEKLKSEEVLKRLELQLVQPAQISKYRSLVMRAAFLAQDRPDLSETVKCLARKAESNRSGLRRPQETGQMPQRYSATRTAVRTTEVQRCGNSPCR